MMTWMTTDGRTVTWEDGLLEGDGFLVDLITGFVRCDALLTQPSGFDMVIASLDDEEQAFNTVTSVLLNEVGLAGLAEVPQFGDPNATDGFVFVKPAERPPLEKWLKVMLKGRQRRFASRSEAGRYAAYVRWANNAGVTEIATPEQWKQMNLASGQTSGGESDDPPHIRDAKQAVADLQADLDEFRTKADKLFENDKLPVDVNALSPKTFIDIMKKEGVIPKDVSASERVLALTQEPGAFEVVGKPAFLTVAEFAKFGEWCEKNKLPGILLGVRPDFAQMTEGRIVFIPSPKTVQLVQKVQAVGEKIKTAIDIETGQNSPEMQEFFAKFPKKVAAWQVSTAKQPSLDDVAKLHDLADKRLEVVSKIIPMGADVKFTSVQPEQFPKFPVPSLRHDVLFPNAIAVAQRFIPKAWGEAISKTNLRNGDISSFGALKNEITLHVESLYGNGKNTGDVALSRQMGSVLRHEMVHAAEFNINSLGVLSLAFQSMATMENVTSRAVTNSIHGQSMRSDGTAVANIGVQYATRTYRIPASEMLSVGLDSYLQFQPQYGRVMNTDGIGWQAWSLGMLAVT